MDNPLDTLAKWFAGAVDDVVSIPFDIVDSFLPD